MTESAIRGMEERDIAPVMEIERASFVTPWTEGMFRSQLRFKDDAINLVLIDQGTIIGYAAAWLAYDEIHLLSIAVAPERRRRGFGDLILDAVMKRGRSRGAERVILEVRDRNTAARTFYLTRGFREIGKRRRYYSDTGEDAIVMERVFEE